MPGGWPFASFASDILRSLLLCALLYWDSLCPLSWDPDRLNRHIDKTQAWSAGVAYVEPEETHSVCATAGARKPDAQGAGL